MRIFLLSDTGQEITLNFHGPGDCFGELALLDGLPRSAGAITMEQTVVHSLHRDDFLRHLHAHPRIAESILEVLSKRLRQLTDYAESLAFLDVYDRVASKLLDLALRYGVQDGGIRIDLSLTQGELATWVVASRERVNKALGLLRDRGLINLDGKTHHHPRSGRFAPSDTTLSAALRKSCRANLGEDQPSCLRGSEPLLPRRQDGPVLCSRKCDEGHRPAVTGFIAPACPSCYAVNSDRFKMVSTQEGNTMSQQAIETILGKAVLEDEFRSILFSDADSALTGYDLTAAESAALKGMDVEALENLGRCAGSAHLQVDPRRHVDGGWPLCRLGYHPQAGLSGRTKGRYAAPSTGRLT